MGEGGPEVRYGEDKYDYMAENGYFSVRDGMEEIMMDRITSARSRKQSPSKLISHRDQKSKR